MKNCLVCGKLFKEITNTHLAKHNTIYKEYATKYNISKIVFTDEHKYNMSLSSVGKNKGKPKPINSYKFPKGYKPWNKGLTKETDKRVYKMSETKRGINVNAEKIINRNTSAVIMALESMKSPEARAKARNRQLLRWSTDLKYINKMSHRIKKNKLETRVEEFLNKIFPGLFVYVGDGKLRINGKNPDFILSNSIKRAAIEVYGDYWHRGEDPESRIKDFAKVGWDCLVIWEHDVKNEEALIPKIFGYVSWLVNS